MEPKRRSPNVITRRLPHTRTVRFVRCGTDAECVLSLRCRQHPTGSLRTQARTSTGARTDWHMVICFMPYATSHLCRVCPRMSRGLPRGNTIRLGSSASKRLAERVEVVLSNPNPLRRGSQQNLRGWNQSSIRRFGHRFPVRRLLMCSASTGLMRLLPPKSPTRLSLS
jgi:hypothetical protein